MQHQHFAHTLRSRHNLRVHGWLIGSLTLLLMWGLSHLQMVMGVDSLALRYLVSLGAGYLAYLCTVRIWAAALVDRRPAQEHPLDGADVVDVLDLASNAGWPPVRVPMPGGSVLQGDGGDFAGAGASGDFGDGGGELLGDMASGALEAAAGSDEGAVVVVPVVAIFLMGIAIVFGAGALAWLYFGWEVLLTVAVELAFSVATARALVGVEREGWLHAAVRLTWKPLLGALLCAVLLGATIDHFLPQADSLPAALRIVRGGH